MGKKTPEEARASLTTALPYFRRAVAEAAKKGLAQLAVVTSFPDGSGQIGMRFDCEEFFEDIETVLGAPPETTPRQTPSSSYKSTGSSTESPQETQSYDR